MKKRIKRAASVILALAMLLSMTGCNKKEETLKKNTDGLKAITVALDWTPNTNHTGLYVALEKGYFEEAGFKVTLVQPPEDGAAMAVATGQAQYGISFQDSIAPLYASGEEFPVTAVAALLQHNTSGIISLKEKGISSPKGMENHSYATWDSPVEKAIIRNVMEADGGSFDKVKLIPSTVTDVAAAFQTDSVDSVWIFYAWDGIATNQAGLKTNMFYFKDINPVFDYYSPMMIANKEYIEANEEDVKAFLKACKQGYEYAIEYPLDAAEILVKHVPELDKKMVQESQLWLADQYKAEVTVWGQFDADRWNSFYSWLYENKLLEKEIPKNYGFTNEYLSQ